ncbi:MAG: Bax inhibitor-1/YccA family protein [Alphaproteobacteria bacterium]
MKNYNPHIINHSAIGEGVDQGLRSYMLKVYGYMSFGLVVTALLAFAVTQIPALQNLLFVINAQGHVAASGFAIMLLFAQIGLVLWLSMRISQMDASTAQLIFWSYAALTGLSLSPICYVYTGASITRVFSITACTFGAMSLYGYTTKKDLSSFASFLFMGLIGIILASVVNIWLKSTMVEFVVSAVGVLVFTGLTAYDTQRIKEIYWEQDTTEVHSKKAIMGALALYLDFINLFLMLLRFFGNRRS